LRLDQDISDQISVIGNLAPLGGEDILQRDGCGWWEEEKEKTHTEGTEIAEFREKRKARVRALKTPFWRMAFPAKRRGTITPRPGRGRRRSQREEHRVHREESIKRRRRGVAALERKSPPFIPKKRRDGAEVAQTAKDGAPSSSLGR
jgi:hypothetical protein